MFKSVYFKYFVLGIINFILVKVLMYINCFNLICFIIAYIFGCVYTFYMNHDNNFEEWFYERFCYWKIY